MEAQVAKVLWGRSVESYGFRYVVFVGDGDSSAYKTVTSLKNGCGPYGSEKPVEKQECINHVSKRFGTRLRKLRCDMWVEKTYKSGKKYKQKILSGKHRLTDKVIDNLTKYYGIAIRDSQGKSLDEMRRSILCSYFHCSSSDESPNHFLCPKGKNAWCFYNEAIAKGEQPPSHDEMQVYFRLSSEERKAVLGVYNDLSSDELLKKCMSKRTQNPNESLHSKIWNRLLKTKFHGRKTVEQSVCLTMNLHNFGYRDGSPVYDFGFESVSEHTVRMLANQDKERIRLARESVTARVTRARDRQKD